MSFTHLHNHTHYSLLDGLTQIPPLLEHVKKNKMDAVAITDHGVLYGVSEFHLLAKEYGIKPIIGCEVYVAIKDRLVKNKEEEKKRYHLTLLAKNKEGYHNLVKIVSDAHINGFYYKPRTDWNFLKDHSKGLIALTGCGSGAVAVPAQLKKKDKAKKNLEIIQNIFGKENTFLEIQVFPIMEKENPNHAIGREVMLEIAKETKTPIVGTNDAHYIKPEDSKAHDVLLCLQTGKKLEDQDRMKMIGDFSVRTPERMAEIFKDVPDEALENTEKIADRIENYDIHFDRIQPKYPKLPKEKTAQEVLKEKTYEGALKRYGKITEKIKDRIDYELKIIHKKGYDDYFLVVADYVTWAKKNGILVGPGRGSGVGSIVAYCLTITNLCPLKYELYFERFLNPERPSPPDFDVDFQDDRRDELFEYMTKTYGVDNTSFIGTFGKMQTRTAIRDVARVMDIELSTADRLSKMVEVKFGKVTPIKKMMEKNDEFKGLINTDERLQEMVEIIAKIEGCARHISTHACGYLVTPDPIVNYIPLQKEAKTRNKIITQVEGHNLEALGFMKFDFLGLSNLTIIKNTLDLVKEFKGKDINIDDIPLDDEATYKTFQKGETTAVFQFESEGMKKYLKELKPTHIEDIIFLAAAYRPGPMQFIPSYIKRKNGQEKTEYLHKDLEPILKKTYGYAIYQEQVLRIARDIAGYSLGEADMLRRAMGKKKKKIMAQEKKKFIKGCVKNGYDKNLAGEIFAYLEPFADYGFNKSHAAAYAVIAYQTAYLKAHYPVEFIGGLMQTDLGDADKITRDIIEAEKLKIKILPPTVNESNSDFTITGDKEIRFGLNAIKNLSSNAVEDIVDNRQKDGKFKSISDFLSRINVKMVNKKSLESLILAGTLEKFINRGKAFSNVEKMLSFMRLKTKDRDSGQNSLFGGDSSVVEKEELTLEDKKDFTEKEKLTYEKELLGLYLTNHPLKPYQDYILQKTASLKKITAADIDSTKTIAGIIVNLRKIITKKGDPMAFLTIENLTGTIEIVVFPRIFKKYRDMLKIDEIVILKGTVNSRNGQVSLSAISMEALTEEVLKTAISIKSNNINHKKKESTDFSVKRTKNDIKVNKKMLEDKKAISKIINVDGLSKEKMIELKEKISKMPDGETMIFIKAEGKLIKTNFKVKWEKE